MKKILIGIDPDINLNGFSVLYKDPECGDNMSIDKKTFFQIFDFLGQFRKNKESYHDYKITVFIEAGWLNKKSNWHVSGKGENVSSRVGSKVGANHQVGKLIVEMCEYLGLEYELCRPVSSKIGIRQFRMMSKYKGKLNQDMVDSAMLVYGR